MVFMSLLGHTSQRDWCCACSGAGTAGLTRQLVPLLQSSLQQSQLLKYVASDISPAFGQYIQKAVQLPELDFKVNRNGQQQSRFLQTVFRHFLPNRFPALLVSWAEIPNCWKPYKSFTYNDKVQIEMRNCQMHYKNPNRIMSKKSVQCTASQG